MTLMAGAVALATSLINAALLARVEIRAARDDADQLARTLYHQASRVIEAHGSDDFRSALSSDPGLRAYAEAVIGYSPVTLYAAILDREGRVLFHSDPRQRGRRLTPAVSLQRFSERDVLHQLWALAWENEALAMDLPFSVDGKEPFGTVRVAISTLLLRKDLAPVVGANAALAAAIVVLAFLASFYLAHRVLAPLEVLRKALKRIDPGEGGVPLDLQDDRDVSRVAEFFDSVSRRLTRAGQTSPAGRAWLDATLGGSPDAVMILDRQGRIRFINESGRRLLGEKDHDRLHGRTLDSILDPTHPLPSLVRRAMQDGTGVESSTESIEVGDSTGEHLLSVQALRDHDELSGFMLTARDMRQLSRLASSLSYSQKLAALGRLTSGVAHEIRKPLQAMVMNVELLQTKVSNSHPDARRHLDVLTREIRQLDRVIEGFLQFTRPEELRPEPVNLEQLLSRVTDTIASVAERNDVHVDSKSEPNLPRVHGSEDLLRQAFLNILTNACDAMPSGGKLRLSASHSDGNLIVTVQDTGVGIPPEHLPKVFDLYHTTKEGGSGIGLSLVYRIVQLHGGEVRLESEVGIGTLVTVSLPVAPR